MFAKSIKSSLPFVFESFSFSFWEKNRREINEDNRIKYTSSRASQEVINRILKTRRAAFHNFFSKHMERRRPYTCTMPIVRGTHVRWPSVTTIEIPLLLLWYSTKITMAPLSSSESWITFDWVYGLNCFWYYLQVTWGLFPSLFSWWCIHL